MARPRIPSALRIAPRAAPLLAMLSVGACTGEEDGGSCLPARWDGTPFAHEVVDFRPGPGAGFGQEAFPCVVLGPPQGGGLSEQSLDVLSLGVEGEITLRLGLDAVDGPGSDLLVFENPFLIAGSDVSFAEPGRVSVSEDGVDFVAFPCDPDGPAEATGCAGVRPVLAPGPEDDLDPTDPAQAGGDAFDLASVGLPRARFVRIRDAGVSPGGTDNRGFDLDAVAVVR